MGVSAQTTSGGTGTTDYTYDGVITINDQNAIQEITDFLNSNSPSSTDAIDYPVDGGGIDETFSNSPTQINVSGDMTCSTEDLAVLGQCYRYLMNTSIDPIQKIDIDSQCKKFAKTCGES